MASKGLTKSLTLQQQNFLSALANEARGDLVLAKKLSGYSPNTALADIVAPIKEHIINLTRDILMNAGPKAAFGVLDVIDSPSAVGAANKLKASAEVLDRIGVVKPEANTKEVAQPAIFILPPKNVSSIKVTNEGVTVDMKDEGIIVEYEDMVSGVTPLDKPDQTSLDSRE